MPTNITTNCNSFFRNIQVILLFFEFCVFEDKSDTLNNFACNSAKCSPIFTARCYASAVLAMGLCPCLSVSVTSRCSTKTAKRRITQTTPHDTPRDSSFLMPKISAKFDRGHPLRGRQMQVGWVKIGDFRQITGYISKTVEDRHIVSVKVE